MFPADSQVYRPAEVVSKRQVAPIDTNKDVLAELRAEISNAIRQIASQYVLLYPSPTTPNLASAKTEIEPFNTGINNSNNNPNERPNLNLADRKAEFLHYLSRNGIYHEMKERLNPKIQRVVRERYGLRGRALGRLTSPVDSSIFDDHTG